MDIWELWLQTVARGFEFWRYFETRPLAGNYAGKGRGPSPLDILEFEMAWDHHRPSIRRAGGETIKMLGHGLWFGVWTDCLQGLQYYRSGTVRRLGTFTDNITNAVPGDWAMKLGAVNHKCAESASSREKVGATSPHSVAAHFSSLEICQAINAQ